MRTVAAALPGPPSPRRGGTLLAALLAYGPALAGGLLFAWAQVPLPWMVGPLATVAAMRLLGLPARPLGPARNLALVVIGCTLGLNATPEVAARLVSELPLILLGVALSLAASIALSRLLERLGRIDATTAFFASLPGGAGDMVLLGESFGGRPSVIAVTHLLRIAAVVVVLPTGLALLGLRGTEVAASTRLPVEPPSLLLLLALGFAAAWLLLRAGVRLGWLVGPLLLSFALAAAGAPPSGMPAALLDAAQLAVGAQLGASFDRDSLRRLRRFLPAAVLHVLALTVLSALAGLLLAAVGGVPVAVAVLGAAPGGVAEMALTARNLQLDVPLVTTFHLVRLFAVALSAPPLFRLYRRLPGGGTGPP